MKFLIIGNPESRRSILFESALRKSGVQSVDIVPHMDLLSGKTNLSKYLKPGVMIRIETSGENERVERELIRLGASSEDDILCETLTSEKYEKGLILHPRLWYKGFSEYLQRIYSCVKSFNSTVCKTEEVSFMNAPEEILKMFDKSLCHKMFRENNIRTAQSLGNVASYDELQSKMLEKKIFRVFIKLRYCAGASGIVAYQWASERSLESATTTVELTRKNGEVKLYNSLKIRKYTKQQDIKDIINCLCIEHVHVEKWIPKSGGSDNCFDARFVVINKKACHRIARFSSGPITNLHLGNQRKVVDSSWISQSIINEMEDTAEKAASLFPDSFYSGVDLILPRNSTKPVVIEINAFGDLLNNVEYKKRSTHQYQTDEILKLRNNIVIPAYETC
ncbi:MAG: hypothetical protein GY714_07625 [Desulfobacterales bacterium]|nr:hypothetical protein [Desulfobacterales bacterium]MCP4161393.1 hypothetical protein [Deltaproteobacteria bacterium]